MRSIPKLPSKVRYCRPRVEQLESRVVPTGGLPFTTIATGLSSAIASVVSTVGQDAGLEKVSLPILGQSLSQEAVSIQNAMIQAPSLPQ